MAESAAQPRSALCGLFDLQPAGEGIAKLIAQVGDLIGHCRIGIGLQQRAEDQSFVPTKELRKVEIERALRLLRQGTAGVL
jgi:hypothetical protein